MKRFIDCKWYGVTEKHFLCVKNVSATSAMKCKDCKFLRTDVKNFGGNAELPAKYGKYTCPCNRYPMNIMRSPQEPACGEFREKK